MSDGTAFFSPVKLSPVYKDYIWGGDKLKNLYHKESGGSVIAESWELSTHRDGISRIADMPYGDLDLRQYIRKLGQPCLGNKAFPDGKLPVLVKFIDARDDLSIQVHPDDAYAQAVEKDNGKTEMWVILENEPGAYLYLGVNQTVSKEEIRSAVENGTLPGLLRKVPARKGDVFFIPAGTIHAIGRGLVICEIQQSSNVTYRLYDYGRRDRQGNPRVLHAAKALDAMLLDPQPVNSKADGILYKDEKATVWILKSCPYFTVYRYAVNTTAGFASGRESFIGLIVIEGSGALLYAGREMHFQKGETIFLPAQELEYEIAGKCEILAVTL